jgi:hypothetical protein
LKYENFLFTVKQRLLTENTRTKFSNIPKKPLNSNFHQNSFHAFKIPCNSQTCTHRKINLIHLTPPPNLVFNSIPVKFIRPHMHAFIYSSYSPPRSRSFSHSHSQCCVKLENYLLYFLNLIAFQLTLTRETEHCLEKRAEQSMFISWQLSRIVSLGGIFLIESPSLILQIKHVRMRRKNRDRKGIVCVCGVEQREQREKFHA